MSMHREDICIRNKRYLWIGSFIAKYRQIHKVICFVYHEARTRLRIGLRYKAIEQTYLSIRRSKSHGAGNKCL